MIPVSLWAALGSMPENLTFETFKNFSDKDLEDTRYEIKTIGRKRFATYETLYSRIEKYQELKEIEVDVL